MARENPVRRRLRRLAPAGAASLLLSAATLATVAAVAPGCGGGSPPPVTAPATGRVRFTIRWPEKSSTRLIPRAAKSIRFRCLEADDADELILETSAGRGETVVTLDLPSVKTRIVAEACAEADGTGQVLAKGSVTVQVPEAQVAEAKLALDSVIKEVRLSHGAVDLAPGQVVAVSADAYDADGAVVLTDPDGWEWAPEDEAAAKAAVEYRRTGYLLSLQAKADGACAFTVTEKDTGKTARVSVTSRGVPEPTPTPSPTSPPREPGLYVTPTSLKLKAGEIAEISGEYQHADGRVEPIALQSFGANGLLMLGEFEGKVRVMALYPHQDGVVRVSSNGSRFVDIPSEATGRLVIGHLSAWSKDVDHPECAVYIDDQLVGTFTDEPNELGKPAGMVLFPYTAGPGRHKLKIVNQSSGYANDHWSIRVQIRITNSGVQIGMDESFYKGNEVHEKYIVVPEER